MDFALKHLAQVANAINVLLERNQNGQVYVKTKRIRQMCNVEPSDRSTTNFIWRSLHTLHQEGILEVSGTSRPKIYKVTKNRQIDVPRLLLKIKDKHHNKRSPTKQEAASL